MNKKQLKILYNIYDKFNLHGKKTFVQHRNLTEFKHFGIERINPTHRIFLFGRLKKKYYKNKDCSKFIKVGEIILYSAFVLIPTNNILLDIEIKFIIVISIFSVLFDLTFDNKLMRFLDVNRYRRKYWKRKNSLCSTLC